MGVSGFEPGSLSSKLLGHRTPGFLYSTSRYVPACVSLLKGDHARFGDHRLKPGRRLAGQRANHCTKPPVLVVCKWSNLHSRGCRRWKPWRRGNIKRFGRRVGWSCCTFQDETIYGQSEAWVAVCNYFRLCRLGVQAQALVLFCQGYTRIYVDRGWSCS